jgi:hypothetical protein
MRWGSTFAVLLGLAAGAHAATFGVDTTTDDPARTACEEATPDDCNLLGEASTTNGFGPRSAEGRYDAPRAASIAASTSATDARTRYVAGR